jgi:hypothetical protein
MKRLLLIFTLFASLSAFSQKSSITLKSGYTISNVDNYKTSPNVPLSTDTSYTKGLSFIELGLGYSYKPKNWVWFSIEPGLRIAGHRYSVEKSGKKLRSSLYFNAPIVTTFNMAPKNMIIGLDFGFNSNFRITGDGPNYYPEIIVGPRLGYKASNRLSFEVYYRYGEGLKPYYSDKALTTNYISLQTRVFIGK